VEVRHRRCSLRLGHLAASAAKADQVGGDLKHGASSSVKGNVLDLRRCRVVLELGDDPALMGVDPRGGVGIRGT
jgi:hypothetical protein